MRAGGARRGRPRVLEVEGASEHNLRGVDVEFGPGLTAVVGVSGSGKSSLVFDTVYNEARRKFMETLALGSPWLRVPPADVRRISGLGPAVSIAQNVLNRNPTSTVASSTGMHPFFRILYSRFADVACPRCAHPVRALSEEERLTTVLGLLDESESESGAGVDVEVPLVRGVAGSHDRLLAGAGRLFDRVAVDGRAWRGRAVDADAPHDIVVRVGRLEPGDSPATVRALLERADAVGSAEVVVGGRSILRAPICPGCGSWVRPLEPSEFQPGAADTSSHRIDGLTLDDVMARTVEGAAEFVDGLDALAPARRVQDELRRRLEPLLTLGLGHLTLDRSMPTLSRGEAQRTRLAVVLAGRLEDLLHVLDEPTIGLHHSDEARLLDAIAGLPGPVLMVEHDRTAIAMADDVVEIGPGGGEQGGRLVFHGTPAALWKADTPSGRGFSTDAPVSRSRRPPGPDRITIARASARNLSGFDVEIPLGLLTVVTGPSGAGKTTLVRDVLLASLAGRKGAAAVGCESIDAPALRAIAVDQAPLGNNPRSNPATYTKVFDRIRALFAKETGRSASEFTFNRPEGACEQCEGMGAIEVRLPYVASTWVTCDVCDGTRFTPESLTATWRGRTIADILDLSVDAACDLFAEDPSAARTLRALQQVGLGYVRLGQSSPSLSGGEAQRVRLARELTKAKAGDLVVLDEPTTGLHPADLSRLVQVLDGLTELGCTVVVVEHQPDVVAAADWIIDLGPGGGPAGGQLLHCGPPASGGRPPRVRPRATPRKRPRATDAIRIEGARANNLQSVDVEFPKGAFTVVTGVSGSGKSSLVGDVLAAEASRRLLECLSVYERQSAHEGPEAPVDAITGLGPTLIIDTNNASVDGGRATVGRSSELDRLLAVVLSRAGARTCLECGGPMSRSRPSAESPWRCDHCGAAGVPIEPRHLVGSPVSFCRNCLGRGVERRFIEEKLIRRPDEPVCGRCLHSPGYYPKNYMCTPGTGMHPALLAFARRHGFDPFTTPWAEMSDAARHAFIWGDPEPFDDGQRVNEFDPALGRTERGWTWSGLHRLALHDIGGMYSEGGPCTACDGRRLRRDYLAIRLGGHDRAELFSMPLASLDEVLESVAAPVDPIAVEALATIRRRVRFLRLVGLGYLHLDRGSWTLSAGEAQRVKLASVLGGGLLGMTVLLDEPSRGLHPQEVVALTDTLLELRDAGNTVITVEHDVELIRAADHVIEVGPGAGRSGGRIVDPNAKESLTRRLIERRGPLVRRERREPAGWMHVRGARENNLRGDDVEIPLGVLVGVCGVSGSGKSSLVVDTIGLALAPPKVTTSIATRDRLEPGAHDAIEGAPKRVMVADQAREAVVSAGSYLGIVDALRRHYASSDAAEAAGVTEADIKKGCDLCGGRGSWRERMWFLPSVTHACDACGGTGYRREAASLSLRGHTLADVEALTLEELAALFDDVPAVVRACDAAKRVGLGYLVVRQPGWSLSGGEAQRLKLAKELGKRTSSPALYLLDEPTVGLHLTDVAVLIGALDEVIATGSSVVVVEHHPDLLAACDWLIELGPGAGPAGGQVIFSGPATDLAAAGTATSRYVKAALG